MRSINLRYLNLPKVPNDLIDDFIAKTDLYPMMENEYAVLKGTNLYKWTDEYKIANLYKWTDEYNERINIWGQKNICEDAYFGFQIMKGNVLPHKDHLNNHYGNEPLQPSSKLVYLISQGGENVLTRFWLDDKKTLINEYNIQTNRWHLLQIDTVHSVEGVEPGKIRWSIVAQMLHRLPYERQNKSQKDMCV